MAAPEKTLSAELLTALQAAGAPRILVIGDLMLDRYVWGDVDRVSPEAPVPVVQLDRGKTHTTVGGAGSVVRDLVALGARVTAAGLVGGDPEGASILETLNSEGVDTSLVVTDPARRTTEKTRVLAKSHHLLRIDSEEKRPLDPRSSARLTAAVVDRFRAVDAVILSDYDKGVLNAEVIAAISSAARAAGRPVWADPARGRDFAVFRGVTAVTPNRRETEEATGLKLPCGVVPREAARALVSKLALDLAIVTLDSEGMFYMTASGEQELVPAGPRLAHDVTGAGDMVIAAAVFAVAAGMTLRTAVHFANFAAGMEVERIGVQPIPRAEMLRRLSHEADMSSEKLLSPAELKPLLEQRRRRGEKVVLTNGCFDILHAGHIMLLQFARAQGDLLVVALNSDRGVRALKGAPRPIILENDRAGILAALASVDYVVIFDEDTPAALINDLRPDILVKGEDWKNRGVAGRDVVEAGGGRVVFAPLVPGLSTTGVVERILDAYSGGNRRE